MRLPRDRKRLGFFYAAVVVVVFLVAIVALIALLMLLADGPEPHY